jgi:hypothetical protein
MDSDIPSPAGMSLTKLSLLFQPRESLVSVIPDRDGNVAITFFKGAAGVFRQGKLDGPSITVQVTPAGPLSSVG